MNVHSVALNDAWCVLTKAARLWERPSSLLMANSPKVRFPETDPIG